MGDEELKKLLTDLIERQDKLIDKLDKLIEPARKDSDKKKDFWDRFATISTFLSTVVIGGIGLYFTQTYNIRQSETNRIIEQQKNRVAELDIIQKFLPSLTGREDQKQMALVAITSLGNPDIATKIAQLYPSQGSINALTTIAATGNESEKKLAKNALQSIGVKGIDLYEGAGKVSWKGLASDGFKFAFVRATEGSVIKDAAFPRHWKEMKNNGIIRGAYHFFHPGTSDPVKQAQEFIKTIGKFESGDLPPVLDVEITDGQERKVIINNMKKWLREVEKEIQKQTGKQVKPIISTYPLFWTQTLGNSSDFADYPLWIANLDANKPAIPSAWKNWTFWQYQADVNNVKNVQFRADLNKFNGSLDDLHKLQIFFKEPSQEQSVSKK